LLRFAGRVNNERFPQKFHSLGEKYPLSREEPGGAFPAYARVLTLLFLLITPVAMEGEMARGRLIRLQIMLDNEELNAIENWRFQTRMPSRAAAVREIMRRGLAAEGFKIASNGAHSESYGILHTPMEIGKLNGAP
jgi:hypothetical protein